MKKNQIENIILFRHGKAESANVQGDFARHLTPRGKTQATHQAQILQSLLTEANINLDLALISPAVRTVETWEQAQEFFPNLKFEILPQFYLASEEIYWRMARKSGARSIIIIAHNPGLHYLARKLLRGNDNNIAAHYLNADFPTSAITWFQANKEMKSGFELMANLRPIAQPD